MTIDLFGQQIFRFFSIQCFRCTAQPAKHGSDACDGVSTCRERIGIPRETSIGILNVRKLLYDLTHVRASKGIEHNDYGVWLCFRESEKTVVEVRQIHRFRMTHIPPFVLTLPQAESAVTNSSNNAEHKKIL